MRDLYEFELKHVSGAGCSPTPPTCPPARRKGNNGYGNGGGDGVPGGSDKQDVTR